MRMHPLLKAIPFHLAWYVKPVRRFAQAHPTIRGRESRLAPGLSLLCSQYYRFGYNARMRPLPATPNVPGDTPAERLSNALNMVLKVSKADLLKEEARHKRSAEKKRTGKRPR